MGPRYSIGPTTASRISRTAPSPPFRFAMYLAIASAHGWASAGDAEYPAIRSAATSLISSPTKQISDSATLFRSAKDRKASSFVLQSLVTSVMPNFRASASTTKPPSPEIRPNRMPFFRVRDTPMMSAKWIDFRSSPAGPIDTVPFVNTPSISRTTAFIALNAYAPTRRNFLMIGSSRS